MALVTKLFRGISLLSILMTAYLIIRAAPTIATHINRYNVVDATGSRWMLSLYPVIQISLDEFLISKLKHERRQFQLTTFPHILVKEWYLLTGASIIGIILMLVGYQQITL